MFPELAQKYSLCKNKVKQQERIITLIKKKLDQCKKNYNKKCRGDMVHESLITVVPKTMNNKKMPAKTPELKMSSKNVSKVMTKTKTPDSKKMSAKKTDKSKDVKAVSKSSDKSKKSSKN